MRGRLLDDRNVLPFRDLHLINEIPGPQALAGLGVEGTVSCTPRGGAVCACRPSPRATVSWQGEGAGVASASANGASVSLGARMGRSEGAATTLLPVLEAALHRVRGPELLRNAALNVETDESPWVQALASAVQAWGCGPTGLWAAKASRASSGSSPASVLPSSHRPIGCMRSSRSAACWA